MSEFDRIRHYSPGTVWGRTCIQNSCPHNVGDFNTTYCRSTTERIVLSAPFIQVERSLIGGPLAEALQGSTSTRGPD